MRAVDTNVLVRLITRDDPRQVAMAEAFIAEGGGAWVSHVVLVETAWVLTAVYELGAGAISTVVEMLLNHQHLSLQDADVVAAALARYRAKPGIALSDCLVLEIARKAGHVPLGTFDRQLARLDGAQRL
jgi:predicted nucleic-acid-binding protein